MKKKDPALWAACRIHRILSRAHRTTRADSFPALSRLISEQESLARQWRLFDKAQGRGWTHAAEVLRPGLISLVASVHAASGNFHLPRVADAPSMGDVLAEIQSMNDEFGEVEIDVREKRISVTTDEIVLEDITLGAFSIHLHFDRLARRQDVSAFLIVAAAANPSAQDSSCTHPHVQNKSLCAGDATIPISHALSEGRIGDAFQLVNRVLHTYNASSAYVALSEWEGRDCADCGRTTSDDGLYVCTHCDGDFCDDCMRSCDRCEQSVCLNCSTRNADGERVCPRCKELIEQERQEVEESALDDSEVEPQPSKDTTHEHAHPHSPDAQPQPIGPPGGAPDREDRAALPSASAPQAA